MRAGILLLLCAAAAYPAAEFSEIARLVAAGKDDKAISAAFGDAAVKSGKAVAAQLRDMLFAIRASSPARVTIDDGAPIALKRVGSSDLWIGTAKVTPGTTHNVQYLVEGQQIPVIENVRSYDEWAYDRPGVPKGKLSEKMVHESKIYPNSKTDWWIYVPAQYDASKPAALMVWQDGQGNVSREGSRVQIMIDNLTAAGKIPVIVHVFIAPAEPKLRSVQYDRMDDTYVRFLRDEILPQVSAKYKIRTDSYSRAITGSSSGGICAFNAAWQMNDQFSRVLTTVGSYTSIQWKAGERDGGNLYPFIIRKSPKKNIRVWMQDGNNDLENTHGSWPLQNLQMANSLKMQGYDFKLRWTTSAHGGGGSPDRAEGLIWLWRGYDPSKTSEEYQQDPAEKDKPYFRVKALNRTE